MNDSLFNEIQDSAKYLNLDLNSQELAQFAMEHDLDEKQLQALSSVLSYLQEKKKENIISTLLKLSRFAYSAKTEHSLRMSGALFH